MAFFFLTDGPDGTRLTTLSTLSSEPAFEPATITHNGGAATQRDQAVRDSEVAVVPRDQVVRCIEARARSFQGWRDEQWIERLRTQRYRPGGHYNHHFDWSSSYGGWGRVSSFMVWVDGSPEDEASPLLGGGTEFPLVKRPSMHADWCRFIECDAENDKVESSSTGSDGHTAGPAKAQDSGVVFKPLAGNAVSMNVPTLFLVPGCRQGSRKTLRTYAGWRSFPQGA